MKTLCTYGNLAEAGFAQSLLETAGIQAELADENTYAIGYGRVVGDIRLQVKEEDLERAQQVLSEGPSAVEHQAGHAAPPQPVSAEGKQLPHFPAGIFVAVAVALIALFFAVAQWRERQVRGQDEEEYDAKYDLDGDGRIDMANTYRGKYLYRSWVDRNHDGKPDSWSEHGPRAIPLTAKLDENYDGKPDVWFTYEKGRLASGKSDRDFNGVPDVFLSYKNDLVESAEVRPNESPNIFRRQSFTHGVLRKEEVDENGDGRFDYSIDYDVFGTPSEHLPVANN